MVPGVLELDMSAKPHTGQRSNAQAQLQRVAQRHALSDFDSDQFVQVHHREYDRVTTTAICGLPRQQYDVAFVDWRLHSIKAL